MILALRTTMPSKPIAILFLESTAAWSTAVGSILHDLGHHTIRMSLASDAVWCLRTGIAGSLVICGARRTTQDQALLADLRSALPHLPLVLLADESPEEGATFAAVLPWPPDGGALLRTLGYPPGIKRKARRKPMRTIAK